MTQVHTIEGDVVVAFRPSAAGSRRAAEMPQGSATVILFTGTRYERRPDAPAASDGNLSDPDRSGPDRSGPERSGLDLAHS